MERDIFFYIAKAMERSGCKSERALCVLLGMAPNTITSYRRYTLPTDETMEKLARIAGIDPQLALLDLNIWRSDGPARAAYQALLQKIKAVLIVLGFSALLVTATPSHASRPADNSDNYGKILYIMENKIQLYKGASKPWLFAASTAAPPAPARHSPARILRAIPSPACGNP